MKGKLLRYFLNLINKFPFRSSVHSICITYIDIYNEFSYNFEKNGERQLLEVCTSLWNYPVCFFDVGANVGDWAAEALSYSKNIQIHCFEMSTSTYKGLSNRYAKNKNVTTYNLALSDVNGEIPFRDYGENNGGNTLLIDANYHAKHSSIRKTVCVRGDDFCKKSGIKHINLLKLDTEGSEFFVLCGFEEMLRKNAIDIIQFEYGYTHADAHTLMRDFYKLLLSYGYIIGALRKDGVRFKAFTYSDNDFKSGPNYVACLPSYQNRLEQFI